jgi:cytochrome c oxidase subunit 3
MALGSTFLGVKVIEYMDKWTHHLVPGHNFIFEGPFSSQVELFYVFYFTLTGLHALHMIIGLGILAVLVYMAYKNKFSPEYNSPVEMTGLYWHFVDIVWIYLFPFLYLIGRS